MRKLVALPLAAALGACASSASDIKAQYISPMQYQAYTCPQLIEEVRVLSSRVAALSGEQNSKATSDAVFTTVAVVVFWPAAFAVKGDGITAAELGRLKGEMEAIERVSIQKNCGIRFEKKPPLPEPTPAEINPRT